MIFFKKTLKNVFSHFHQNRTWSFPCGKLTLIENCWNNFSEHNFRYHFLLLFKSEVPVAAYFLRCDPRELKPLTKKYSSFEVASWWRPFDISAYKMLTWNWTIKENYAMSYCKVMTIKKSNMKCQLKNICRKICSNDFLIEFLLRICVVKMCF